MSDFLLDICHDSLRTYDYLLPISFMTYFPEIKVKYIKNNLFSFFASRADGACWEPYIDQKTGSMVAIAGRPDFDENIWDQYEKDNGGKNLAGYIIYQLYEKYGTHCLSDLSGAGVVFIFDKPKEQILVYTDPFGTVPCFMIKDKSRLIIGSHPDLMAKVSKTKLLDTVSIASFIVSGKLWHPFTYYRNIEAMDCGSISIIDLKNPNISFIKKEKYFSLTFENLEHDKKILIEMLYKAFEKAVRKRCLKRFGNTFIALSGGLDSRMILLFAKTHSNIRAVTFFDKKNREYKIAEQITKKLNIQFVPLQRSFEHYGSSAVDAVKISGGTGDIANNHFLSFRKALIENGMDNLITGCYCDYLFKGLVLDSLENKISRRNKFAQFSFFKYSPFYWFDSNFVNEFKIRIQKIFPVELQSDKTMHGQLEKEKNRIFPLYYEPDNLQRIIPQRTMGWYLPVSDHEIARIYNRIPAEFKLNGDLYKNFVWDVVKRNIPDIHDANTGTKISASPLNMAIMQNWHSLVRKFNTLFPDIATDGSWPNWNYYIANSSIITELWHAKKNSYKNFISEIINWDPYSKRAQEYSNEGKTKLFLRLLTLKIWVEINRFV